jgi:hypothetical protein
MTLISKHTIATKQNDVQADDTARDSCQLKEKTSSLVQIGLIGVEIANVYLKYP